MGLYFHPILFVSSCRYFHCHFFESPWNFWPCDIFSFFANNSVEPLLHCLVLDKKNPRQCCEYANNVQSPKHKQTRQLAKSITWLTSFLFFFQKSKHARESGRRGQSGQVSLLAQANIRKTCTELAGNTPPPAFPGTAAGVRLEEFTLLSFN